MSVRRYITVFFLFLMLFGWLMDPAIAQAEPEPQSIKLYEWEMQWETSPRMWEDIASTREGWEKVDSRKSIPKLPEGVKSAWIRIRLPELDLNYTTLYFKKLYANAVEIWGDDGRRLFHDERNYFYDVYHILLPLDPNCRTVYIHMTASIDRIGIQLPVVMGEYQQVQAEYAKEGILEIVLGSAMILIALIMLLCAIFLRGIELPSWLSLTLVIFSLGVISITYSKFTYMFFDNFGHISVMLFDLAMMLLFPCLTYFFMRFLGNGPYKIIWKFFIFQVVFSGVWLLLFLYFFIIIEEPAHPLYTLFSFEVFSVYMIIQFTLLIMFSISRAIRKNKDAILFAVGFSLFSIMTVAEVIWYIFVSRDYELYLWKWGLLSFVICLILILGRKIAENHRRVISYAKELELFNGKLQQSEKMEILSELAASVAHEVRNPLQVTRGFLQLLGGKSGTKEQKYLNLALTELDRASEIITDFLTFAKPELDEIQVLDVADELRHIEGILMPMATMHGGAIELDANPDLRIQGNSSKFKQAFINMIKNSIEAFTQKGLIRIEAYERGSQVIIRIEDNGIGMDEEELKRLGEPYFSNKTKGTGLGLMVTFRIIEVMQGKLHVASEKGVGTVITISFPAIPK
ncbi:HAMP domain-containing histidine kinase [Paenibacillus thiaminolyticus]|uniref:histidine kinase n=1 Tax=Paenibacillus thiaminolyticus TaxID=49283 RepID=A0AAP9J2D1_PANTH|nr:sensor histidine kinase [Paenibacillus thiaminolyticus]MCY9536696.1 HAMP domain-containing histidine kinase [Paenibacillus thiaminolyticus]MCY9601989.1 HAMP domain-containing histidine kinase [Paenibacillus thiaminolyticus]MCY9609872.1 HAMP domain-containing histidine kinase [Paenibacillus thiaminolyticus]MCY9613816.1 HAMP domain-containing histidine kinase [Paenibacillus thiaminolyticus]MCY9620718.1 HAMP domain-containing histidine kinase [Paenibacillus thiaminolyticus]